MRPVPTTSPGSCATVEIIPMSFSPSTPQGGVSGPLAVAPADGSSDCKTVDYRGADLTARSPLPSAAPCPFAMKASIAADLGAVAAVIYNNVDAPLEPPRPARAYFVPNIVFGTRLSPGRHAACGLTCVYIFGADDMVVAVVGGHVPSGIPIARLIRSVEPSAYKPLTGSETCGGVR